MRDRILVGLYVMLAAAPAIAIALRWPDLPLSGALPASPRPALTYEAFHAEQYQPAFTAWFESSLGFRNTSITVDSTVLFHTFRETKPLAHVVVGNHDVLFERDDINFLNKPAIPDLAQRADELAGKLADLQARLRAQHRAFVPVIVPSKTSIYRDAVPDKWKLTPPFASDDVYPALKRALDAHGVVYVDARALLATTTVPRQLVWAQEARHWSELGACLTLQQIAARYRDLTDRPLAYDCPYVESPLRRSHDDFDLVRLLNAWSVPHSHRHAHVTHGEPSGERPRAVFVASSFGWQIVRDAETSHQFGSIWLDYYDSTQIQRPTGITLEVTTGTPAWRDVFRDEDLYVYELFETYLFADNKFSRVLDALRETVARP
jgi:hypothetical protein